MTWPFSSLTLKFVPGRISVTVPSISIASFAKYPFFLNCSVSPAWPGRRRFGCRKTRRCSPRHVGLSGSAGLGANSRAGASLIARQRLRRSHATIRAATRKNNPIAATNVGGNRIHHILPFHLAAEEVHGRLEGSTWRQQPLNQLYDAALLHRDARDRSPWNPSACRFCDILQRAHHQTNRIPSPTDTC